jgi:hypothetical protein
MISITFAPQAAGYNTSFFYGQQGCITPPSNQELRRSSSATFSSQVSDAGHSVESPYTLSMPSTPQDVWDGGLQHGAHSWSQDVPFHGDFTPSEGAASESAYSADTLGAPFQYNQPAPVQESVHQQANLHPSLRSTVVYPAERYDNGLPTPTPINPYGCLPISAQSTQDGFADVAAYTPYFSHQIPQDVVPAQYHQQQPYASPWPEHYAYPTTNNGEAYDASPAVSFGDEPWTYAGHNSQELVVSNQVFKVKAATPQHSPARPPNRHFHGSRHRANKRRSAKAMRRVNQVSHTCFGPQDYVNPQGQSFRAEVHEHHIDVSADKDKEHKCTMYDHKRKEYCMRSFDRLEHLNRHQQSHVPEARRKFFCPLHDCPQRQKRISRSDNAVQHIKTHLKAEAKGTRNHHHSWLKIKQLMVDQYEPKVARQLIKTIEKDPALALEGSVIRCRTPPA